MEYGTEKAIYDMGNGSKLTDIKKWWKGDVGTTLRYYQVRVKVTDSKQEMTEFIRFTDHIRQRREDGKLYVKDDQLRPAFIVDYPATNLDGSYFIVKSWCEIS